jgi:hypothetical protein
MATPATPGIRVGDADTHLTEPVDLWTARIPERFRDRAPRVALDMSTRLAVADRGSPGQHGR